MAVYIVPDWLTIIAGLVIYQHQPEPKILLGIRSKREAAGKWCLPTGLGAIRRDISDALAERAPQSLKDPTGIIQSLSKRHQLAFSAPGGFAEAEAKWYVDLPSNILLEPLEPVCQLDYSNLLVKIYFAVEWSQNEPPKPAKTEWPFEEVKFFTKDELNGIVVAFGCDEDLEKVFWPWLEEQK